MIDLSDLIWVAKYTAEVVVVVVVVAGSQAPRLREKWNVYTHNAHD